MGISSRGRARRNSGARSGNGISRRRGRRRISSGRALSRGLPPWGTVHFFYRRWRLDGTWERIEERLRTRLRHKDDRHEGASAAIIDTQRVKTAEGGEARGYGAGE